MPAILIGRPECKEEMWNALKRYIIRSRQKKKEEQEADEAEERQRKSREEQEQKDRMTLGETRDQIREVEVHLSKLRDEKHLLFLDLKKVLNEDETRRRHIKENHEFLPLIAYVPPPYVQQPQFGYKPSLHKEGHPQTSMSTTQDDESRRGVGEYGRAVLWNKSAYTGLPQQNPFHTQYPVSKPVIITQAGGTPRAQLVSEGEREREIKRERENRESREFVKKERDFVRDREKIDSPKLEYDMNMIGYSSMIVQQKNPKLFEEIQPRRNFEARSATHVPIHGGAIPIQQPPEGAKTGSITSGYPVRIPAGLAAVPQHASPHASPQPRQPSFQPTGRVLSIQPMYAGGPGIFPAMASQGTAEHSSSSHQVNHMPGHLAAVRAASHVPSHPSIISVNNQSHSNHHPSHAPGHPSSQPSHANHPNHPSHSSHASHPAHAPHSSNHANHPPRHLTGHPTHSSHPGHSNIPIHPPHPSHPNHPSNHAGKHLPSHGSHPSHLGHPTNQPPNHQANHHPSIQQTHQTIHGMVTHPSHPVVISQVHVSLPSQVHQNPPDRYTMANVQRD